MNVGKPISSGQCLCGAVRYQTSGVLDLAVALGGFCLNQLIVWITTALWAWPFWMALIPVVIIVPLIGFIASRYWAYRQIETV